MEITNVLEKIQEYVPFTIPIQFILGFITGYITRLIVGRTKGVFYSIKNLFRIFK